MPLPSIARSKIEGGIAQEWGGSCELEHFDTLPSTNQYLSQALDDAADLPRACVASRQTAGVGRRGKTWVSPPNSITLSLAQSFAKPANELMGLSLVTGLATVSVLERYFESEFKVKWPNDILLMPDSHSDDPKKLAGILTELKLIRSATRPYSIAITGIGLNVSPGNELDQVDQPFATLDDAVRRPVATPTVDELSGQLIGAMLREFDRFSCDGWASFALEWESRDFLAGREVNIQRQGQVTPAIAKGVNSEGALMIEISGAREAVYSGEVSVRAI